MRLQLGGQPRARRSQLALYCGERDIQRLRRLFERQPTKVPLLEDLAPPRVETCGALQPLIQLEEGLNRVI